MSWPYGLRAEPTGAQHITSNIVTLFQWSAEVTIATSCPMMAYPSNGAYPSNVPLMSKLEKKKI